MNEIEKMYENAGAELRKCSECNNNVDCGYGKGCYPPFTAEKQIELIKWMVNTNHRYYLLDVVENDFEESLAKVFNLYWQDLTEEEKQQVKGILE
jgi:hypothetical protein